MALGDDVELIAYNGNVFEVDKALRVVVRDLGVGYIDGNVHTFPGRFGVWFPEGSGTSVSLDEIEDMTEEARCWIAGYLAGAEPSPSGYLGVGGDYEPSDEEMARWGDFCARFRASGYAPVLERRPVGPLVMTDDERAEITVASWQPWAVAGEQVWVPNGEVWVLADPQPEHDEDSLAGSLCEQGEGHDMLQLATGWTVCCSCGYVVPD